MSEWNQQYVVRPQVTYLLKFSVWSGAVVKCWRWLGTPSGQFLLPTSCVALFRFFIGRTQKNCSKRNYGPVTHAWRMRICQIFISKTVGQQQQNDRVGTVAITFSPWSGHERMFFKSGINRQRLAFNFDLLPYTTWWRFSSALTKEQINVLFKLQFEPIEISQIAKVIPHFCIQHNARITRIYSSYKSPLHYNSIKCKNISASDWLLGQRQSAWRQLVLCNLETFFIHENESYGKKTFKLILKLINFNGPLLAWHDIVNAFDIVSVESFSIGFKALCLF